MQAIQIGMKNSPPDFITAAEVMWKNLLPA